MVAMKKTIKEKVVVEGSHDAARLKQIYDVDCIITHGTSLDDTTMKWIGKYVTDPGVIVFTDPDAPGEMIRKKIMMVYPQVKHAYIDKTKAKTDKKVGVEHGNDDAIIIAMDQLATYDTDNKDGLTMNDMVELKLSGYPDSDKRRKVLSTIYPIGLTNAKTCLKRLNYLHISKQELENIDYGQDRNL